MYRFLVRDHADSIDLVELTNLDTARVEAVRTLGGLLRDDPEEFWTTGTCTIVVQTENGLDLLQVDVAAVMAPAAGFPSRKSS